MVQKAQGVAALVAADVIAGALLPGASVPSVRTLAAQAHCSAGTAARAHTLLREAGVIAGHPRSQAFVTDDAPARALAMNASTATLRLCGSDDPALDLLLSLVGARVERVPGGRGSVAGLALLAQGAVHAAAVHLRDLRTGRHNDTFARRLLGGEPATLVHLWSREQGIVVAKGNPLRIRGAADLEGARLAWRPPGTGSRLLLNRLLGEADVRPDPRGELCETHIGVAVAVATGAADAGVAIRAAAESVDADFVPLGWEDFELAVGPQCTQLLAPILQVCASTSFRERLAVMDGYDLARSGETRVAA
jgi:molybdate-binding protein